MPELGPMMRALELQRLIEDKVTEWRERSARVAGTSVAESYQQPLNFKRHVHRRKNSAEINRIIAKYSRYNKRTDEPYFAPREYIGKPPTRPPRSKKLINLRVLSKSEDNLSTVLGAMELHPEPSAGSEPQFNLSKYNTKSCEDVTAFVDINHSVKSKNFEENSILNAKVVAANSRAKLHSISEDVSDITEFRDSGLELRHTSNFATSTPMSKRKTCPANSSVSVLGFEKCTNYNSVSDLRKGSSEPDILSVSTITDSLDSKSVTSRKRWKQLLKPTFRKGTFDCLLRWRGKKPHVTEATQRSSRPSYGDDAISYVQIKREGNICTVKCKICPEHKVHAKLYAVTLMVDEDEEKVTSIECHDCVAAQGGCKHAIALLMWVHRRSEEPSCTEVQCYWRKSKLSRVGITLKFISAKDLSKGSPILPSNSTVFEKFLKEGRKRKLSNCELLKYQQDYNCDPLLSVSMHQLVHTYKEECCDLFLSKVNLTAELINHIENATRDQFKNNLWYELRYGRVTASKAYEVSRCQTDDGTLISAIMGGKIPDTPAMKRGRYLENEVREIVSKKQGIKIKNSGLFISQEHPMLAGSPDGICQDGVVEIKCPISKKTYLNYIKDGKPSKKCFAQIQMQMYLSGLKKCYFCVADPNFSTNKNVEVLCITFDDKYMSGFLESVITFWKSHVYPLLYKSIE